jgi:hypothetical protein
MGVIKDLYAEAEQLLLSNDPAKCGEGTGMINILDKLTEESYVNKIDWSELRNQKRTLLQTIKFMEDSGIEYGFEDLPDNWNTNTEEIVSHLTGLLHLIDALQDFAVDELGVDPIHVFDFEDEENRTDDNDRMVTLALCPHCSSDNFELKYWVNANTQKVGTDCEEEEGYCCDCEQRGEPIHEKKRAGSAGVIGFQVVDEDDSGEIHPDMDGSFCLYSLSQAKAIRLGRLKANGLSWKILAIWSGDVENPTFMFEGDPRN